MFKTHRFAAVLIGLLPISLLHAQIDACSSGQCAYQNPSLKPEDRAANLVKRMTLDEKVSQTLDHAKSIPRLGVPEYNWWNEALHGVARNGLATVFPQAIGIASTWDPELVESIGDVVSTEARGKHNEALKGNHYDRYSGLTFWSPNINIFRDPRWGRGQETYGEDPFLTATIGVAFIHGLQGDDRKYLKVVATPKHFAVHSGPEPSRHGFDVNPSPFDLEDTYLPAFRAAITQGHADSIMCAYNAVDHVPACASTMLLQDYLRTAWHFNGFVVSDCDAVNDVEGGHHYVADAAHASAVSLKAGTDLDCGSAYNALNTTVSTGLMSERDLDAAVVRLFTARFRLGMFDLHGPWDTLSVADVDTEAHKMVALRAASESIVLLENKHHALPLTGHKRIAVVGPTADLLQAADGNYQGTASHPVLPLQGMRDQFGSTNIVYSPGATLADGMAAPIPATALSQARNRSAPGLKAEYFAKPDFSGALAMERVDSVVNFNWDGAAPDTAVPQRNFSVRWTGFLSFPAVGKYTLRFRGIPQKKADMTGEGQMAIADARTALRVYLDDQLAIDSGTGASSVEISAQNTESHSIRIEYTRVSNDRYITLEWIPPADVLLRGAIDAARSADVVVAFVGLSPDLEGEEMKVLVPGFNGGDRTSLDLPAAQEHLLEAMKATGKPLVVVLTSGSALSVNWAAANADALLEAWYGGEEAGKAIATTLAGANNPSGRLPVTFYKNVNELPSFDDYSMSNRTYRYFKGKALYGFGYGLSYSSFNYEKPEITSATAHAGADVVVNTKVTNTSEIDGDEVVEAYLAAPGGRAGSHPFLAGFERVYLKAKESKTVAITLRLRQLSRVNEQGERTISAGAYRVFVAGGQPTAGAASTEFVVEGNAKLPK